VPVHATDAGRVLLAGLAGVARVVVAPAVEITRIEVLVVAHLVSNGLLIAGAKPPRSPLRGHNITQSTHKRQYVNT
jgi:hypothetical protein